MTMATSILHLAQIDMAATNLEAMVKFYERVFDTSFRSYDAGGVTLYSGKLFGIDIVMAPNTVAGVVAEQSRHQFEVTTHDMADIIKRVEEGGGSVRDDSGAESSPRVITVLDPDSNTTVFIEHK